MHRLISRYITIIIINRVALRNNDFKNEIHISSLFLLSETRSQVITILTEIRKWRLRSFAYGCEQKKYGEQRENEGTRRRGAGRKKKRGRTRSGNFYSHVAGIAMPGRLVLEMNSFNWFINLEFIND